QCNGLPRSPTAHLDAHAGGIAHNVQSPAAGGLLHQLSDRGLVAAHRGCGDQLLEQLDLTRQDPPRGRSPFPCGPRSSLMWVRSTPPVAARMQASTLGRMPPESTPLLISPARSSGSAKVIRVEG